MRGGSILQDGGAVLGGVAVQLLDRVTRDMRTEVPYWVKPAAEIVAAGVVNRVFPRAHGACHGVQGAASYQWAERQEVVSGAKKQAAALGGASEAKGLESGNMGYGAAAAVEAAFRRVAAGR